MSGKTVDSERFRLMDAHKLLQAWKHLHREVLEKANNPKDIPLSEKDEYLKVEAEVFKRLKANDK